MRYLSIHVLTDEIYKKNKAIFDAAQQCDIEKLTSIELTDPVVKDHIISFVLAGPKKAAEKYQALLLLIKKNATYKQYFLDAKQVNLVTVQLFFYAEANINVDHKGSTVFHYALSANIDPPERLALIKFLLEHGGNPNITDEEYGYGTFLHMAIANEIKPAEIESFMNCSASSSLIQHKIDYSIRDKEGKTLLITAAKTMNLPVVKNILKYNKNCVNLKDNNGATALHYACALGQLSMVRALLDAGADIMAKDNEGNTPLHYANCSVQKVEAILRSISIDPRRDINARFNVFHLPSNEILKFNRDNMAEFKAVESMRCYPSVDDKNACVLLCAENVFYLKLFIENNPNLYDKSTTEYLQSQIDNMTGVNVAKACMYGHENVIFALLLHNAEKNKNDIMVENTAGKPPFVLLFNKNFQNLHLVKPDLTVFLSKTKTTL